MFRVWSTFQLSCKFLWAAAFPLLLNDRISPPIPPVKYSEERSLCNSSGAEWWSFFPLYSNIVASLRFFQACTIVQLFPKAWCLISVSTLRNNNIEMAEFVVLWAYERHVFEKFRSLNYALSLVRLTWILTSALNSVIISIGFVY